MKSFNQNVNMRAHITAMYQIIQEVSTEIAIFMTVGVVRTNEYSFFSL